MARDGSRALRSRCLHFERATMLQARVWAADSWRRARGSSRDRERWNYRSHHSCLSGGASVQRGVYAAAARLGSGKRIWLCSIHSIKSTRIMASIQPNCFASGSGGSRRERSASVLVRRTGRAATGTGESDGSATEGGDGLWLGELILEARPVDLEALCLYGILENSPGRARRNIKWRCSAGVGT